MFSALVRKEWRQLRLLRWGGSAIGLILPPLLFALVEAGKRGWLFGDVSGHDSRTILLDLLPGIQALAMWPLLTLMTAAQALTADRAAGTDVFLLQQPVPRAQVWRARLLAALGTALTIVVVQAVLWLFVVFVARAGSLADVAARTPFLAQGGVLTAIALLAGIAAAGFVRTPTQALLLGLVLVAVPIGIGGVLGGQLFIGYRLEGFPVGVAVPMLLLVGYALCSFRVECRGEPAGRGRLRRGLVVLGAAAFAMPVFFAASAPMILRWDARLGLGNTRLVAAAGGTSALAINNAQRAAWLIDLATHRRLRRLSPPVWGAAWDSEGARIAVLHSAGGSGRWLPTPRIEILDAQGNRTVDPIECATCQPWSGFGVAWSGDWVVTRAFRNGRDQVLIVSSRTGEFRFVDTSGSAHQWVLAGAQSSDEVFLAQVLRREHPSSTEQRRALLLRVDVDRAELEPLYTIDDVRNGFATRRGLSPSAKQWLRIHSADTKTIAIVDLESGEEHPLPAGARWAAWLSEDRLVWAQPAGDDLWDVTVRDRDGVRPIGQITGAWLQLTPSPDGRRVLCRAYDRGRPGATILDPETGDSVDIPWWDVHKGVESVQWAGPRSLAIVGQGFLGLADVEEPAEVAYVVGRPGR